MQGVAAKDDASYDLSRARASVTGQTTIAASTATTSLPNGRIVTVLFAGALFLSAFLLFVLEPMVAKSILPTLGGAPMAWNTRLHGAEVRIEFVRWLCPGYVVPYSQTTPASQALLFDSPAGELGR